MFYSHFINSRGNPTWVVNFIFSAAKSILFNSGDGLAFIWLIIRLACCIQIRPDKRLFLKLHIYKKNLKVVQENELSIFAIWSFWSKIAWWSDITKSVRKWRILSFVKLSPATGHSVTSSERSSNAEEMVRLVEGQRRKTVDLAQFRFPRRGSSLFSSRQKMSLFCFSNTLETFSKGSILSSKNFGHGSNWSFTSKKLESCNIWNDLMRALEPAIWRWRIFWFWKNVKIKRKMI